MPFRLKLFTFFLLLSWAGSACNFPYKTFDPNASEFQNPIELPLMAVVKFQVQLPEITPQGEIIYLSILDEVTGLALNIQRHEMQTEGDLIYSTSIPLPVGAIVKYRYSRQGEILIDEHNSNSTPVRYRMYKVINPGIVEDVVSAWSDTEFIGETGRILGRVTDSQTSIPLAGLLVAAGGYQTFTDSEGSYLIEGLPPGIHNLVIYSLDGQYQTFQQGASVAPLSTTPASIQIDPFKNVSVEFTVTLPEGTLAGVPVRLAGNLLRLGNTFNDLSGGMNVLASRMPVLNPLSDGRYSITIELPAGGYLEYKYTLGDGFWNAEHHNDGTFYVRNIIVPDHDTRIVDQVENWGATSEIGSILFDLTVPQNTPASDQISIQFNPFGWTEPVPMWSLGNNRWVYVLYGPLANEQNFSYRYCRNDQCGSADDTLTPGSSNRGRAIKATIEKQTIEDEVVDWKWWEGEQTGSNLEPDSAQIISKPVEFLTGVELDSYYHPSYAKQIPRTLRSISEMGAGWMVFTPSWTYTRLSPPVLEPIFGYDPFWEESNTVIDYAQDTGLNVAIYPTPRFQIDANDWWVNASRDFAWWLVWFERYRSFVLYHADLANHSKSQGLILGGDWIRPALPGGFLADGSPSGLPADAEQRWRQLITEVREHFGGEIFWAVDADPDGIHLPPFVEAIDKLYLLWSLPLSPSPDPELGTLVKTAANYMEREIFPLELTLNKPVIIALGYPSADGVLSACVPESSELQTTDCLAYSLLARPNPEISSASINLLDQYHAYQAVLMALNDRQWIDGIVSRGFYPPVQLQDYSMSVHGKPAQELLTFWFTQFKQNQSNQ